MRNLLLALTRRFGRRLLRLLSRIGAASGWLKGSLLLYRLLGLLSRSVCLSRRCTGAKPISIALVDYKIFRMALPSQDDDERGCRSVRMHHSGSTIPRRLKGSILMLDSAIMSETRFPTLPVDSPGLLIFPKLRLKCLWSNTA